MLKLTILLLFFNFLVVYGNPVLGKFAVKDLVTTATCENCFLLNNGKAIPVIGLGTSRIGQTEADVIQAIKDGIEVGYRHIDTADFYLNEKGIGKALEELFKNGTVKREDLFVTTKVWSNHHTEDLALQSVRTSLDNLKLTYLDLVLVHWPQTFASGDVYTPKAENGSLLSGDPSKENFELAYKGLEKAVRLNLTRSIGVSNFNKKQLEKLVTAHHIKPVLNQVESHPMLSQVDLLTYATGKGIRLEAYSPLRRGNSKLFQNETLKQLASKYGKSVAQVALRWQIQRGVVVIPKSSKRTRMIENRSIFDFTLTDEEMVSINGLNANEREIKFEDSAHLAEYPF